MKKKGLSEVVSTLILIVVAVLLAGVVAYYATNITTTRTETEALHFASAHVWVNRSGAIAGFKLQNLGGRDILIDKFIVRGVESDWADVFIYRVPLGTSITGARASSLPPRSSGMADSVASQRTVSGE